MKLRCKNCGREFEIFDSVDKVVDCPDCRQKYRNPLYKENNNVDSDIFF